ncbi:putative ABC transporter permease [uncultured Clostridium sp.]|uniref:putative ABC transporter permease n=1 Tax=uncultured Clostridium sp. TaxID=59620 RepID=UPI0025ED0AB9|nr:putative ABC transporter permease [uncultured Clostridium sp.]
MINLFHNNIENIYDIVYLFTFYSFGGWCLEVSYYFKNERRFVNRGFLKGPFCPIYGSCIVLLIFLLEPYKHNIPLLFLSAFFITSLLEYITGFVLEKAFKTKCWDYSDDPFNIHGRVCLPYSLIWGTGEVIIITVINPIITRLIYSIPYFLTSFLFYLIVFYFLLDFSLTVFSLLETDKFSYPFEFASINLSLNKVNSISNLYRYKASDKFKTFSNIFQRLKLNNKKFIQNFNSKSSQQLNIFIKNIKDKIKKY